MPSIGGAENGAYFAYPHPRDKTDFGMEINKFGFRNAEISEKKPDDTFRAVFMGDSFTEGYGVEVDDGIVAKSEKRFRDHHPNTNFEFINAGIRGGAPTTYRRQIGPLPGVIA